jgi:hypothetical protein
MVNRLIRGDSFRMRSLTDPWPAIIHGKIETMSHPPNVGFPNPI